MTNAQLLEKIRGVLLTHPPVMKTSPPLQVPARHISTRDFPHEQSKSSAMRTNDKPPAERVQRLSLGDPVITDKGVADRTFKNPQFFNHDKKPSSQANSIRARCRDWLECRLSDGPVPLVTVLQEAKTLGFSTKAIRLARSHLNVRTLPCLTLTCPEE